MVGGYAEMFKHRYSRTIPELLGTEKALWVVFTLNAVCFVHTPVHSLPPRFLWH